MTAARTQLRFVKGHCGWDIVTLIPEGQLAPARELEAALKILAPPQDGGLEVGFLGPGTHGDEIRLRMVDSTTRSWIPMCGGMSQVIGKALVESSLRDLFHVDVSRPELRYRLLTPSGVIPIVIEVRDERAVGVTSVMDEFAAFQYAGGVEPLRLLGCSVLRVDDYCVFDLDELERSHPQLDFTRRDTGPHLDIVNGILKEFATRVGENAGVIGMMFDRRPEGPGQFRIYPRFLSENLAAARLPYEFQCGTGTVTVGIALAYHGLLPPTASGQVLLEWGSQRATPDPYGIRLSRLEYQTQDGRLVKASFSHSVVEILSEGTLTLPGFTTVP